MLLATLSYVTCDVIPFVCPLIDHGSRMKALELLTLLYDIHYFIDERPLTTLVKAIFHCGRFARAGGATNFNHVKNQSRGHAKKVECSSILPWRVREHSGGQKMHRLGNYRES